MLKLTDASMFLLKDDTKQVYLSFKQNKLIIDILDESVISDFVDLDFIRVVVEEMKLFKKEKAGVSPFIPIIVAYKGVPMAEVYPDGRKKLHPIPSVHLGIKLLVHRIVDAI